MNMPTIERRSIDEYIQVRKALDSTESGQMDELEIRKAFESNDGITNVAELTNGAALQFQYLDTTMVSIVAQESDFRMLRDIPRVRVDQTLVQRNKVVSHGNSRYRSAFVGQSQEPSGTDQAIKRVTSEMAYMADSYRWNRVIGQTRNVADPEIVQSTSSMIRILESIARGMWYGDKSSLPTEFNGLATQLQALGSEFVIDARGALPSIDSIQYHSAQIYTKHFGNPNKMIMAPGTKALYDNLTAGNGQVVYQDQLAMANGVRLGKISQGVQSSTAIDGMISFVIDRWIDSSSDAEPMVYNANTGVFEEGSIGANPPATPTFTATASVSVPGSRFTTAMTGVRYKVVAQSEFGTSKASAASVGVNVGVGGAVTLVITPGVTGSAATRFVILRETASGSNKFRAIADIARSAAATTTFIDLNQRIPGTTIAIMGDFNASSISDEKRTMQITELMPPLKTLFPAGVGGLRMNVAMIEWFAMVEWLAVEKFRMWINVPTE